MATYTFDTNVIQEAALTARRLQVNADRARQTPPLNPFDNNAEFVDDNVRREMLGPLVAEFINRRKDLVADAYVAATNQQRATVDTALGI